MNTKKKEEKSIEIYMVFPMAFLSLSLKFYFVPFIPPGIFIYILFFECKYRQVLGSQGTDTFFKVVSWLLSKTKGMFLFY